MIDDTCGSDRICETNAMGSIAPAVSLTTLKRFALNLSIVDSKPALIAYRVPNMEKFAAAERNVSIVRIGERHSPDRTRKTYFTLGSSRNGSSYRYDTNLSASSPSCCGTGPIVRAAVSRTCKTKMSRAASAGPALAVSLYPTGKNCSALNPCA